MQGRAVVLRGTLGTALHYNCLSLRNDGGSHTSEIGEYDGVGDTVLASETSTTWAVTDTLRCTVEGTSLTLYRNGASLLVTSDVTTSSGKVGIAANSEGAVADVELDNFQGGDLADLKKKRVVVVVVE